MLRTHRTLALGCLLLFSLTTPTTLMARNEATPVAASTRQPSALDRWIERLQAVDQMLMKGDYEKAYRQSNALLATMTARIVDPNRGASVLALASAFRAVAEAGRGNETDAAWDLAVARLFVSGLDNVDLEKYGDIGQQLATHLERAKPSRDDPQLAHWDDENVRPAKSLHSVPAEFPAGLADACVQGVFIANIIVGRDGVPQQPVVLLSPGGAVMSYAALQAIRQWRFKPARQDGEPVDLVMNVSINFQTPECPRNP